MNLSPPIRVPGLPPIRLPGIPNGLLGMLGLGPLAGIANGLAIGLLLELLAPRPLADGELDGRPLSDFPPAPPDWGPLNQAPNQILNLPMPPLTGDGHTFQTPAACTVTAICTGVDKYSSGVETPFTLTMVWSDSDVVNVKASASEFSSSRAGWQPFGPAGNATARVTFTRSNGSTSVREQTLGVQANTGNGMLLMTRSWSISTVVHGGVPLTGGQEINRPIAANPLRDLAPFRNPGKGTTAPDLLMLLQLLLQLLEVEDAPWPVPPAPDPQRVPVPPGGGGGGGDGQTDPPPLAPPVAPPVPVPPVAPIRPQAPPQPQPQTPAPPAPLAPTPPLPQEVPVPPAPVPPPVVRPPAPMTPLEQELSPDGPLGNPQQLPPPTLQGIATEVARIEQKVLQLLRRPAPQAPDTTDILQLLGQILEALMGLDGSGGYQLSSPCEKDASGVPLPPVEVNWGQSLGLQAALVKRLDALAELLQVHKDLRQPICRPGRAQGQPVTVTFEEVPEV